MPSSQQFLLSRRINQGMEAHPTLQLAQALLAQVQQEGLTLSTSILNTAESVTALALATLRRCLNDVQPVSRLPPEILSSIMCLAITSNKPIFQHTSSTPQIQDLNFSWTMAHVCHQWRQAALGCPFLWCTIDSSMLPAAISSMLQMSGMCLLNLQVTNSSKTFARLLQEHSSRIRTLRYIVANVDDLSAFNSLCNCTKQLQDLRLELKYFNRDRLFSPDLDTSSLTRLTMISVPRMPENHFTALRFLHLAECSLPSLLDLHHFLTGAPNLEELFLDNIFFEDSRHRSTRRTQPVPLHSVCRISMRSVSAEDIADFLSPLTSPPKIVFLLSPYVGTGENMLRLPMLDSARSLWTDGRRIVAAGAPSTFVFKHDNPSSNGIWNILQPSLCAITELCADGESSDLPFDNIIPFLPSLERLACGSTSLNHICAFLIRKSNFSVNAYLPPTTHCPSLKAIHCAAHSNERSIDVALLVGLLDLYIRCGHRIQHLVMEGLSPQDRTDFEGPLAARVDKLEMPSITTSWKTRLPAACSDAPSELWE